MFTATQPTHSLGSIVNLPCKAKVVCFMNFGTHTLVSNLRAGGTVHMLANRRSFKSLILGQEVLFTCWPSGAVLLMIQGGSWTRPMTDQNFVKTLGLNQ